MGQDSAEIRRDIEATRARMSDTAEALGYQADIPARLRDRVNERIETVKGTITDAVAGATTDAAATAGNLAAAARDRASDLAAGAQERAGDAVASARETVSMVVENPLGIGIGALAFGFLAGLLLPMSDAERERVAPIGREIASRAQNAVAEAVDAAQEIAQETSETAAASAKKHARTIAKHAVEAKR